MAAETEAGDRTDRRIQPGGHRCLPSVLRLEERGRLHSGVRGMAVLAVSDVPAKTSIGHILAVCLRRQGESERHDRAANAPVLQPLRYESHRQYLIHPARPSPDN